jgi:hypothetical protein
MKKKVVKKKRPATLESVSETLEEFGGTLVEFGETLSYVVQHMATRADLEALRLETKTDMAALRTEFKSDITSLRKELKIDIALARSDMQGIYEEIKSIKRSLFEVHNQLDGFSGLHKEIDYAFKRIAAIEKHLGIAKAS